MYKKTFFILILLVLIIFTIGCSNPTTTRTTKSSTTNTITSTETEQTGTTTTHLIVGTIQEAQTALDNHLANIAQSPGAKTILADFYNYFQQTEIYIRTDSTIIEAESDAQILWRDFNVWEIAYFVSAKNWDLFPDLFNGIFTYTQELVHPASGGNPASYKYTIALRWSIDPRNGEVITANENALHLEAELSK